MFPLNLVHTFRSRGLQLGYFCSLCSIDPTWIIVNNIDVYMRGMLLSQSKNMQPVTEKTTNFHAFPNFLYRDELKKLKTFLHLLPNPA